jgi:UDP-2,3-diacylglucosamine pyrophosphatase LpxH
MQTKPNLTTMDLARYLAALWMTSGHTDIPEDDLDFHQRLADAFNDAVDSLKKERRVSFIICCHPHHGGSDTIRTLFTHLIQLDWARRESPGEGYLILKVSGDECAQALAELSPELKDAIATIARKALEIRQPA